MIFYPFTIVNGAEITPKDILQKAASGDYNAAYDINRDGKVNAMDALLLLRSKNRKKEVKYTYDTLDRLVRYECNRGTIEYKYDVCGNRTEIKFVP
jgi:YD repeat-containing protein